MAINRFDKPAQAEFINTYVPIPFDQMMKIGMMKQQLVEQNDQAAGEILASLGSVKVAAPDEENYLALRNEYQKELNTILGDSTPGSYEAKKKIMNLRTKMALDPTLRAMMQNYEPYNKGLTELNEKMSEYGSDAAAVYARQKQYGEFSQGKDGVRGTKYLMQQGVHGGILQPAGIGPNEKLKPEIESYIDDMAADSWGTENTDKSGKYIIKSSGKGLGYEKLGAPLGVQFEQYVEGGKKMLRLATTKEGDIDLSKVHIPQDIFRTKAGQTLRAEAEKISDQSGGEVSYEEALKKGYLDIAYRSIQERVSQSSEYSLKEDPYGMKAWSRALEDQKLVYTVPVLIGEKGDPTLSSYNSIDTAKDTVSTNMLNLQKARDNYIETYAKNTSGESYTELKDDEGRDVSSVISEFNAQIQQEEDKFNSLDRVIQDVKRDKKIPANWRVTDDYTKEEIEAIKEEAKFVADNVKATPMGGKLGDAEWRRIYENEVATRMAKGSPNYQIIDKALKANAENKLIEAGVTTFPTKASEEAITNLVFQLTNEGEGKANLLGGASMAITDAKTGEPYSDKDYEKMDRTGKTKPEVTGLLYSAKRGWPQLYTRFKNKDGELMRPALIDAPEGVEDLYIQAGKLSAAEVMLQRQFADATATADQTGSLTVPTTVILGEKTATTKEDKVELRIFKQTRQANMPAGNKYELTFINPETGGQAVKNYNTREAAINAYINYKVGLFNYRKTNSFDVGSMQ